MAINKCPPGLPIVYIFAAGTIEAADQHLTALDDAGATTGYLLDVTAEDDDTIRDHLRDAGLVILGDGERIGALRGGLSGAAIETLESAYGRGAVIFGIGVGATLLGQFYLNENGELKAGYGWLSGAILIPESATIDAARVSTLLAQHPDCYVIRLARETALVFGGAGQVERWGAHPMGITLGQHILSQINSSGS
jgi:hypothetical protein